MTYEMFDLLVLPFPFSDKLEQKRRPALVVSSTAFNSKSKHVVALMITTAKRSAWPLDVEIADFAYAGLPLSCLVRMKFFTADQALIVKKLGSLSNRDREAVQAALSEMFGSVSFKAGSGQKEAKQ